MPGTAVEPTLCITNIRSNPKEYSTLGEGVKRKAIVC